jgi:ribokinase
MSRVFVLGNAMMDLTLPMARLPLPGETVVADDLSRAPGGKGLNQAVVAARAGAEVFFQAAVGRDADAAFIAESLARERFAGLTLLPCDAPTDVSVILVAADAENSIVSLCRSADAMQPADATAFAAGLQPGDWLVVQGNLSLGVTVAACAAALARGGQVLFNAAPLRWRVQDVLAQTDSLVVNRVEAALLSGLDDPLEAARGLCAAGARRVIVTLGADGCLWLDGEMHHHRPAPAVQPVDSTGAGDSFCGVLAAALAGGLGLESAILRAQAAASLSVTRRGAFAALPSTAELQGSSRAWVRTGIAAAPRS